MQSSQKKISISAIICTYNIPDIFYSALESLINQNISKKEYEIIIVDHNLNNQIPLPIQEIINQNDCGIRYIAESKKGLSAARNTGIKHSKADIIAFIDDDAVADSGWLSAILEIYEKEPHAWAVGGEVKPIWGADPPDWFDDSMLRSLSIVDWGNEARPLIWPERVIGTNFSFRREVFEKIGQFDPELGRKGSLLLGNEDTEIQERIHEIGKYVYYTPDAIVFHHIPPERLTKKYFFNRSYGTGRSEAILSNRESKKIPILKVVLGRSLNVGILFTMHFLSILNEKKKFHMWKNICYHIGYIHQSMNLIFSINK